MDVKQINSAIMFGTWSNEELNSMLDAIKFARAGLQKQNIRTLRLGSTVSFTSSKRGLTIKGTVEKIALKFVTVRDLDTASLWKVPANMLTVV